MIVPREQAAQRLVDALANIVSLSVVADRRPEEARRRFSDVQTRFNERMETYLAGRDTGGIPGYAKHKLSSESIRERINESIDEAAQRERAFCDSYEALMHLYAYPEAQPAAAKIASLLREIRLLQVPEPISGSPPTLTLSHEPEEGASVEAPGELRRRVGQQAMGFFRAMHERSEMTQRSAEEKIERTNSLLREALREAQALSKALTDTTGNAAS